MIKHDQPVDVDWDSSDGGEFEIVGGTSGENLSELKQWAKEHPQYWVWYSEYSDEEGEKLEVQFATTSPAPGVMMFWRQLQSGSEGKIEQYTSELASKHMRFFAMLGSCGKAESK